MKFIHAADLHIDSPMRGLSTYVGAPEQQLRGASREAFRNLVTAALDEKVDLVILAGDVFDGDWPDFQTGLFFMEQLHDLTQAGVKVVVLAGNHDAESKLTKQLRFPDGAFKLSSKAAETIHPEQLGIDVAVHGQSYANRDVNENLAHGYPTRVPGVLNIGVLHTALGGRPGHSLYAPCSVDDLRSKGYDYWALGHIHEREVVSEDPWIVFPGNLQGRSVRESGAKGFTLVTVSDGQILSVEHRDSDTARWFSCQIDVSDSDSEADVLNLVRHHLARLVTEADGRLAAVRLTLTGRTSLHHALARRRDQIVTEIHSLAYGIGEGVWIEKVLLNTKGEIDRSELLESNDAVSGLFDTIQALRADPELLIERFDEAFAKLRSKLPAEAFEEGFDPADATVLARGLEAAESHILEVISAGSDE